MIGIIGQGFVGNAIYQKFKGFYDVYTYDIDESKSNSTKDELFANSKVIFTCLPTPMNPDGSCNTDLLESVISEISERGNYTVVIKSTIIPGTTARLNSLYDNLDIVFNPEFLTEANAVQDFDNTTRVVLGGPRKATTLLKRIYRKVFAQAHIVKTGSTHAEMVKYVTNTFLSVKVAYANEVYQICEGLNLDYDKVIEYATFDQRLGKSHWAVPGPDGDYGFGGHCFPKDLSAFIHLADNLDATSNVLEATRETNDQVRKNRDWEQQKGRAVI